MFKLSLYLRSFRVIPNKQKETGRIGVIRSRQRQKPLEPGGWVDWDPVSQLFYIPTTLGHNFMQ